jgi:hypothetical protein
MDTDSIVTSVKLPNEMVDDTTLGNWKLECIITKGYFFAAKMYYIFKSDGTSEFKAKGIKLNDFKLKKFED